jgi:hypothetical protein
MTRYLIFLRCYRSLQDRLEYGERQRLTSEFAPIRNYYAHEDKRIREEMHRLKHLIERNNMRLDDDGGKR